MASILRSSKFVRYIAGFARSIVANTPREFDGNIINSTQCFCNAIPRSFASQVSTQHDQSLETCIQRLDQDVRRAGRISRRDIEDVLEEIRNSRSPTSSQSLLVIRCCGNLVPEEMPETRTKLVQEIWNTLKKLNVPMDVSHYNALLRVYLENEHEFSPTDFLAELEAKGIEPNRVTYQRLIAKYCQAGDIEGATRILEFMREKQLPVNENVFNALVMGHSQLGDMESAHGILAVMIQAGLDPSADTYTTLMCGYAKLGEIESVRLLLNECERKEIFLLDKDYLEIAYAFAINSHASHVPEIIEKTRKHFGYNQEVINVTLRLINKGFDDVAYTIMLTMQRSEKQRTTGAFFLRQMVKADRPVEKILEICKRLEDEQLFNRSVSFVTERSLELGKETMAYQLLHEMQRQGLPIRNHYFWPLILAKSGDPTGQGIINVLAEMANFNVHPNAETIRDYVLPNLTGKSTEIISQLRQANISVGSAACSLVHSLIQRNNLAEAAIIMQTVPAYYNPDLFRRALTTAFFKTNDVANFITIVRHAYENFDKRAEFENKDNTNTDKTEVVGKFLLDLASYGRHFADMAETILEAFVTQGLTITTGTAMQLEEKIGEKMTPGISLSLSRLSSGELIPSPIEKRPPSYVPFAQMNIPQLERLVENLDRKQQDTRGLKRQLLTLYYRSKEFEKMEALCESLEKMPDFTQSTGIYAQLLDACAFHENFDATMKYLKKLEDLEPGYSLDNGKMIRVASVLCKNGQIDEAVEFLKRPRETKEDRTYVTNSLCWRLMNYFADKGAVQDLQRIFDTLLEHEFLEPNNMLLGPLVKVHLVNNDLNAALERFEWCCKQFRVTPWKNELACRLIQLEDAERLQRLTDISTSVHGEINSLYDLVFAFVECGRIRQARKILETPGLQSRPQRINVACQRYQQEGLIEPLEGLCEATKDMNHIDRNDIYYQLLLSYQKQNDVVKAEALWTQMQEEDLTPSDEFLNTLGVLLQNNSITPKFIVPPLPQLESFVKKAQVKLTAPKKDATLFRNALRVGDVDDAAQLYRNSKDTLTTMDVSLFVEKLVQNNRQLEAADIAMEMLREGHVPLARVFRFLLNKLASAGNVQLIEQLGEKLSADVKKDISFDNRVCHANLMAGKASEYLTKLEQELDVATQPDDLEALSQRFPRGGIVGIIEAHPELLDQYQRMSTKFAEKGIVGPMNVLWSHYFINEEQEKADAIWKQYLEGAPRIMFQRIVQHGREVKDEALIQRLITHLKTSKVTEGALGNAVSCLIDILVLKELHADAVNEFESALKYIPIDFINRTAVLRVKESFQQLGKPFEHAIPPKQKPNSTLNNTTSSSSTDTSDDNDDKK